MSDGSDTVARKLGYSSGQELILHCPLRYVDETRLTPIRSARLGEQVQVEATVVHAEVQNRPRRQLVVEVEEVNPLPAGEGRVRVPAGGRPDLDPDVTLDELRRFARELRQQQTDAEALLWSLLRDRRLKGKKFRRQQPFGPYVLDFYCPEAHLAIELDGGQHQMQTDRDRKRSDWFASQGVQILRYWNNEFLAKTEDVLSAIWLALPSELGDGSAQQAAGSARPLTPAPLPLGEGNARLFLRLLHFYPSQKERLKPGVRLRLLGEIRPGFFGAEMVHPQMRFVGPNTPLPTQLTPVYPAVAGLSQYAIAKAVGEALTTTDTGETLPPGLLKKLALPDFATALQRLHHPPAEVDLTSLELRRDLAWQRLKFDELLAQQLSLRLAVRERERLQAPVLVGDGGLGARLTASLPFPLTTAQHRAISEIHRDLAMSRPMNRLLQGDVGSGKTLVAALAVLPAIAAGGQAAVMAPTEILAEQLYRKFTEVLSPLGIRVAWLAAALKGKAKRITLEQIASGEVQVAVGTHALFQAGVEFRNLLFTVVDEQHRFGVGQRLALREKGSTPHSSLLTPHLLMMSATPIPRSLAMSYYADLDVTVIDELPPGRTPITTRVMSLSRREEVISRLRDYCLSGAQAYWVCPLVEESEKLQLKAAEESYAELTEALPDLSIGLVHGRMKADDKAAVMAAFKAGEVHLLVATTVIEVGVDVPNAALMVIEHAERFGLAQLHQLRGRVGRGARESSCLLLYAEPLSDTARQRLRIIKENADGFAIAREDLKLRGPGEFLGARQSGVPLLRFADLEMDLDLLDQARDAAGELLAQHPEAVRRHLQRWLPRGLDYLRA